MIIDYTELEAWRWPGVERRRHSKSKIKISVADMFVCLRQGWTLEEIGQEAGCSRERVRQLCRTLPDYHDAVEEGLLARQKHRTYRDHELAERLRPQVLMLARYGFTRNQIATTLGVFPQGRILVRLCNEPIIEWELEQTRARSVGVTHRKRYSDEDVLELLRACATGLGRTPTHYEYEEWARIHQVPGHQIFRLRFGSWNAGVSAAGLSIIRSNHKYRSDRISNNILWGQVVTLAQLLNRIPVYTEIVEVYGPGRAVTIRNRFGGWTAIKSILHKQGWRLPKRGEPGNA